MPTKKSLCTERARLIDDKFLGRLTSTASDRLTQIDEELDRLDAPRLQRLKQRSDVEFAAIDGQIAELRAKLEKNAPGRPQAKTAGSH